MEQRPLRLGDIVDDYCPRERRITNHAIVAIVGDVIRQTRCSTCDAEHVYKGAKAPRRRKADSADDGLGTGGPGQLVAPRAPVSPPAEPGDVPAEPVALAAAPDRPSPPRAADPDDEPTPRATPEASPDAIGDQEQPHTDGWLAHRRLIRATLPRTEGEAAPPRPIPEFTMHQRHGRGGHGHRGGQWPTNGGEVDGNVMPRNGNVRHGRAGHGHGRPSGGHHGQPGQGGQNGPGQGGGHGRPGRRRRRGHKRPR